MGFPAWFMLGLLFWFLGPSSRASRILDQARGEDNEAHVFIVSGVVHQRADWGSIHEKICQLLIPLRTSMPFYNSEEERKHGLQQLQQRQVRPAGLPRA